MMHDREILLRAADLIKTRGHAKYTRKDDQGGLCIHGALSFAETGESYGVDGKYEPVRDWLLKNAPSPYIDMTGLGHWNNRPERTKEEVIAALEGAAREMEEA